MQCNMIWQMFGFSYPMIHVITSPNPYQESDWWSSMANVLYQVQEREGSLPAVVVWFHPVWT